jgi:hypothetical protein
MFAHLRRSVFSLNEENYQQNFQTPLEPLGGLGLSGSRFFFSHDKSLIIKSLGRYVVLSQCVTLLSSVSPLLYLTNIKN